MISIALDMAALLTQHNEQLNTVYFAACFGMIGHHQADITLILAFHCCFHIPAK
jgi:hypothetical protein